MAYIDIEDEARFVFRIARGAGVSIPSSIATAQAHLGDRCIYLPAEFWAELEGSGNE
jgi:hypothetical protein